MIRFVCTCGHRFEVDDDLAGTSLQCPACGLLTDVPTAGEAASFTDQGTYRLDADRPVVENSRRIAELEVIYAKAKQDAAGNDIDLRYVSAGQAIDRRGDDSPRDAADDTSDDDGFGEIDLKPSAREPQIVERPKYDPETGELIRPIELQEDPDRVADPSRIPVAKATISYATTDVTKPVSPWQIGMQLLMPLNLFVMSVLFIVHVFGGMMFMVVAAGIFLLVPPFFILQGLILSHYGNVVDHTGRNEHDDLPRPLRDLSWYDDIWSSFVAMFGGLMVAFVLPTLALALLLYVTPMPAPLVLLFGAVFGTVFGPAVLLTTNTSGSVLNLRPDRVMHVIRICGGHYVTLVLLWALAWPAYLLGWLGMFGAMTRSFDHERVLVLIVNGLTALDVESVGIFGEWLVVVPALLLGLFLTHYFCWYVGLMYRAHAHAFPWVLQRFIRDPLKHRGRRPTSGHLVIPPPAAQQPPPPSTSRSSI